MLKLVSSVSAVGIIMPCAFCVINTKLLIVPSSTYYFMPPCLFLNFNWRLITLQYCGGLPYIHMNQPWVYMCSPFRPSILPPFPSHLSGSSQCTSPEHPASCIEPGLAICFTYVNIHVLILFSQIIPPSPSPTESNSLFFTSVSLLLPRI